LRERSGKVAHLVIGGTGSIGSAIAHRLRATGAEVVVMARKPRDADNFVHCDVTQEIELCDAVYGLKRSLLSVTYCVGNCPTGGFRGRTMMPLSSMDNKARQQEFSQLPLGLVNTVVACNDFLVRPEGSFVVIGSAITRFAGRESELPEHLFFGHYLAAQLALDTYVRSLRREINAPIHLVKPSSVDTPFHNGSPAPSLIPMRILAEAVMKVMRSPTSQTVELLPD